MKKGKKFKFYITMLPNKGIISNSNYNLLTLQSWHRRLLTEDAALVNMWQLVEHTKSLSVIFITMLY